MPRSVVFKRILYSFLLAFLLAILISEFSYRILNMHQDRPPQAILLVIPAGTADRVAQGESDPALPSDMNFVVGDTLTVKNDDSVSHQLGPLFIPSGASASMHLDTVANFAYSCSFRPDKYLGLDVRPAIDLGTRLLGILFAAVPMAVLFTVYGLIAIPYKKPSEASS